MRRLALAVAGVLAVLTGIPATAGAQIATAPVPQRQQACAEAWSLIAQESAALSASDAAAWTRVADRFLSMSDASFDGPLSNAFGAVWTSADEYAAALGAGADGLPDRAAFETALAGLGGVCARLFVSGHDIATVPRFQRFAYQTGVLAGLSPAADAAANVQISAMVNRAVRGARRQGSPPCMAGASSCGYFVQTLRQAPCIAGMVCIVQRVGLLPVGANDSRAGVTTLVLDGLTGRSVPLSKLLTAADMARFLTGLNGAVHAKLAAGGLGDDPYWDTRVTLADVHSWLPRADGIHVCFDKYSVAPGSVGIVHVVVAWPVR